MSTGNLMLIKITTDLLCTIRVMILVVSPAMLLATHSYIALSEISVLNIVSPMSLNRKWSEDSGENRTKFFRQNTSGVGFPLTEQGRTTVSPTFTVNCSVSSPCMIGGAEGGKMDKGDRHNELVFQGENWYQNLIIRLSYFFLMYTKNIKWVSIIT